MKLKDHSETAERGRKIWPPQWGFQKGYDREHPNMRREEFARQAIIDRVVELRDQCGVLLDVSHPEYAGEKGSAVSSPSDKTRRKIVSLQRTSSKSRSDFAEKPWRS